MSKHIGNMCTRLRNGEKGVRLRRAFSRVSRRIHTHYIHSVVVQDFVSGRVCCVELVSLRVAIATSCDAVCSLNRQDLIHSLVPPHSMYVIRLSNISTRAMQSVAYPLTLKLDPVTLIFDLENQYGSRFS